MIKAKVNIETAGRSYRPGEVIRDRISDADMTFLRRHGFIVEEADADGSGKNAADSGREAYSGVSSGIVASGEECEGIPEYKGEDALKRMTKEEIVEYARSIGLVLELDMLKNDLIESVLNHAEEQMAETE
ncbi:hypothetical protein D7X48_18245 [bacterium D16-50]|nr:hypothetical protein D7X48_18245 [bacterium D16-50]